CFVPDGRALSCGALSQVFLWDLKTGKMARDFSGPAGCVHHVAYNDRARLAAASISDKMIRLWDLERGKTVRTLPGNNNGHEAGIGFTPDGKRLLTVGFGAPLRIWDVETGEVVRQIKDVGSWYAAFAADGQRIVTGGHTDHIVRVWDAATGK